MKLLERLGRKTEKGKPEVRENPIFNGRAADAREEEYQNLKVSVHRAIVDEMSAEQQRVLERDLRLCPAGAGTQPLCGAPGRTGPAGIGHL